MPQQQLLRHASSEPYKAYDTTGNRKAERLDIRRLLGFSSMPRYNFILDIRYSRDSDKEFVIVCTFYEVVVQGENLKLVRQAISDGKCDYIQDYDAREYAPPSPDQPIITSIEIMPIVMYVCPKCKTTATAKRDAHLVCGDCRVPLVLKES
jgi:DNA-directed RNA polymerase subunit RPC12/RpoP